MSYGFKIRVLGLIALLFIVSGCDSTQQSGSSSRQTDSHAGHSH